MSAAIRTTNFDALFASEPLDATAAAVVAGGALVDTEANSAALKKAITSTIAAIREAKAAGRSTTGLASRARELELQIVALGVSKSTRKAANRALNPSYERAFIEEAKRLLSRTAWQEIHRAALAVAHETPAMKFEAVS